MLPGYSDLATTDPELAQEWNAAKNTRKPTEISRLSQYPVWWKGICGHEWKDKVFHRAVEGAGCIYCEKAFLKELPYLLVTMYAKQYGLATRTDDEKLIGARIDAVIPELRLAFAFSQKGTDREAKVAEVLHFLCKAKRIQLFVIRQKDPIALATEIKQAFAKANLFINSDSQRDVAHLRKRYFAQKNNQFVPECVKGNNVMGNDANVSKRDGFRSRGGFIIACIGSAVGMGNIWRFPTLVSKWGGMTFLLPYFLFVILIGSTGVIGEFALGRAAGAGPVDAFGMCTEARWGKRRPGELVGYIPVLGSLALAIGYTCVMGWIFKYTFLAFDGGLSAMGQDMDAIVGSFNATASAWGANVWVVVAVAVSFVIMSFGIAGGIEKANKIMMPILFLLFVGLGIYVATLPGASGGYRYIFTIKPAGLLDPYVWIYAFGQAFFSLSVAGNGSVIYGSYLSKSECIPSSARNVALFDTIAALLAAFVIIPAMAAGGAQLDAGGPGLMFIYLVHVMNGMAGGRIVAMVFFVCVAFAGVTSIINLYEAPVASLQERFGLKRVPATAVIHVIGLAVALCIQAIVSQWMDVVSIYICPLGALLAAVMFFWIGGKKLVLESVNLGARKPIGGWYYPLCKYVYCASVLVALVAGAALGGIG